MRSWIRRKHQSNSGYKPLVNARLDSNNRCTYTAESKKEKEKKYTVRVTIASEWASQTTERHIRGVSGWSTYPCFRQTLDEIRHQIRQMWLHTLPTTCARTTTQPKKNNIHRASERVARATSNKQVECMSSHQHRVTLRGWFYQRTNSWIQRK